MRVTRRTFLSSGVCAAAAAIPSYAFPGAAGQQPLRVSLVAANRTRPYDVGEIFQELGLAVDLVSPSEVSKLSPQKSALLWIVGSTYPDPMEISSNQLGVIEGFLQAGKGVFVEFTSNFPGAGAAGPIHRADVARLFVAEGAAFPDALPTGAILDPHDAVCLPLEETAPNHAIVKIAKIAGVKQMDPAIPPKNLIPGVVLGDRGHGRFAVAATSISEFARRQYAPQTHWQRLLRDLTLTLLSDADRARVLENYVPLRVHTEPRRWAAPGEPVRVVAESVAGATFSLAGESNPVWKQAGTGQYETEIPPRATGLYPISVRARRGRAVRTSSVQLRVENRKATYRRTLDNNIRWFEKSGVMQLPDGSLGVAEWISGPDIEGNRIPFGKRQGFSPERTDCVFESALAFWLYGRVAGTSRHLDIGRNMLVNVMDFQRLSANDEYYGLWYTRGREGPIFQDDEAWAVMGSLAGYRYTQLPICIHRGRLVADTAATVFAKGAPKDAAAADQAHARPSDRGQMIAAWLYAYGVTGQQSFLDLALPALHALMESFPTIAKTVPAHTGEATRFLLPLALACAYSKDPAFPAALREQADYLVSRMVPCGAIQEEGVYTGSKVQGGDLSLIHDSSEPISDQLYTTSFAAMNFWIAYKATGDKFYLDNFFRVADFLVRIQIESPDRTIDGGWMRGFDYSLWEYYGSNADQSWTAYCLETGWANAIIDIAFTLYLLGDSFYEPKRSVGAAE